MFRFTFALDDILDEVTWMEDRPGDVKEGQRTSALELPGQMYYGLSQPCPNI